MRELRFWIKENSSKNVVYMDESGFAGENYRPDGWVKKGAKIFGLIPGKRQKRTNLIMALRGKEWLAPVLFEKSCTHQTVLAWMEQALVKELNPNSLIILDNAPFHNKPKIKAMLEQHGHSVLFLPKYSPDYNPIEQVFAVIKRRIRYWGQSLEEVLMFRSYFK